MMRISNHMVFIILVILLLSLPVIAACSNDETPNPTTAPIETPGSEPQRFVPAYNVSFEDENLIWTVNVVSEETLGNIDCYVAEVVTEGAPQRLRLQGKTGKITLTLLSETGWYSKDDFTLLKTEASVTAFGNMQVDTTKTYTYDNSQSTPLTIWDSWSYEVLTEPSMGPSSTSMWNATVVGEEEITVPAGTFNTYRIEHTKTSANGIAEENLTVGRIEWWSTDKDILGPVKIEDSVTYLQTETREIASLIRLTEPTATPSDTPDASASSDAERLTTGKAWEEFCDSLKEAGDLIMDPSLSVTEFDQAEGYRHLLRLLSVAMNELVENDDPLRPYLTRYPNVPVKIGHDNPDNVYSGGAIQGDQTYRVNGTLGTNVFTSFNVYSGFIGFNTYNELRTISSLNSEELIVEPDGSFEIILSPDPHPGNWLKLEPDAKMLVVRKLFDDWETETEGTLQITNLTMEGTSSDPLDPAEMATQLDDVARFVESVRSFFSTAHGFLFSSGDIPPNTIEPPKVGEMEMADPFNNTSVGHFKLEPGEALLIEFPATDCLYTNIELGNMWWESLDYRTRQTHLNGHMSFLNSDDVYRYVICPGDPGVPNWLDTEGRLEGTMFLRWTYCDQVPESIITRVIEFDEIWDYFPGDTPLVTKEDRREDITARQAVVGQRYKP